MAKGGSVITWQGCNRGNPMLPCLEGKLELPNAIHKSMAPDWIDIHLLVFSALRMKYQEGKKKNQ